MRCFCLSVCTGWLFHPWICSKWNRELVISFPLHEKSHFWHFKKSIWWIYVTRNPTLGIIFTLLPRSADGRLQRSGRSMRGDDTLICCNRGELHCSKSTNFLKHQLQPLVSLLQMWVGKNLCQITHFKLSQEEEKNFQTGKFAEIKYELWFLLLWRGESRYTPLVSVEDERSGCDWKAKVEVTNQTRWK